jgi:hypothetical protein
VVFAVGDTVVVPPVMDLVPLHPPPAVHVIPAFDGLTTVHVSVDVFPVLIVVGLAVKVTVIGCSTLTVAVAVVVAVEVTPLAISVIE